nr:uncharacterized protein LOC109175355 [Ipomoea trifida]
MEKKNASLFILAFVAILLCSSVSSILCSIMEADEDMAEVEVAGGAATSDGPLLLDSCNQNCNRTCITNNDCNACSKDCRSCNHNQNGKICGPSLGLIKLPVTDEENIRIDQ